MRSVSYGRGEAGVREDIDEHSLHFIARAGHSVVGALRVTCRRHGPLESEQCYPQWILDEFNEKLCASSRMCVAPEYKAITSIPLQLTKFAWSTVLPLGIRIDVSKARYKAIPFYMKKMGYFFVRDSYFTFQRWAVPCGLIACPANASCQSRLADIFQTIDEPCDLSRLIGCGRFITSYHDFSVLTKSEKGGHV